MENLPEGSTVGLALDHQQGLHLFINGCDLGVAVRLAVPCPLYPFIDLIGPFRKVPYESMSQQHYLVTNSR
jgi:hypothetical protein